MNHMFITEISEEDFRKLDLRAFVVDSVVPDAVQEVKINNVLEHNIDFFKNHNPNALLVPVTIAIFNECSVGENSFKIAIGIRHIYSTRDYYTSGKDGSWKVKKRYLKAIYRVHLKV